MIIGFDYWQVVSHYPVELGILAQALEAQDHTLHVISAIGKQRIGTVADEVRSRWPSFPADRKDNSTDDLRAERADPPGGRP